MKTTKSNLRFDPEQLYNFYYHRTNKGFYYQDLQSQKYYYQAIIIKDQSILTKFSPYSQDYLWKQIATIMKPLKYFKAFISNNQIDNGSDFDQSFADLNYQLNHQGWFDQKQKQLLAKKWQLYCHRDFVKQFSVPMLIVIFNHQDQQLLQTISNQLLTILNQHQVIANQLTNEQLAQTIKNHFHLNHQDHFGTEVFEKSMKPSFKDFINLDWDEEQIVYYNRHRQQVYFYELMQSAIDYQSLKRLDDGEVIYYHYEQEQEQQWVLKEFVLMTTKHHRYPLIKKWQPVYQNIAFGHVMTKKRLKHKDLQIKLPVFVQPLINNPHYLQTKPLVIGYDANHENHLVTFDLAKPSTVISLNNNRCFDQILSAFYLKQQPMLIQIQNDFLVPWINYFHFEPRVIDQFWFNLFGKIIDIKKDPLFYAKVAAKANQLWTIVLTYQPLISDHLKIYFDQAVDHLYRLGQESALNWHELYTTLINHKIIKIEVNDQTQMQLLANTINYFAINPQLCAIWTKSQSISIYEHELSKMQRVFNGYQALKINYDKLIKELQRQSKQTTINKQSLWWDDLIKHWVDVDKHFNILGLKDCLMINLKEQLTKQGIKVDKLKLKDEELLKLNNDSKLKKELKSKTYLQFEKYFGAWIGLNLDEQSYLNVLQSWWKMFVKEIKSAKLKLDQEKAKLPLNLITTLIDLDQPLILDWRPLIAKGWNQQMIQTISVAINSLIKDQDTVLIFDYPLHLQRADFDHPQMQFLKADQVDFATLSGQLLINANPNYQWKQLGVDEHRYLASIDHRYYYYQNQSGQLQMVIKIVDNHPVDVIRSDPDLSNPYDYFQNQISRYETYLYQSEHLNYQQNLMQLQNRIKPNQLVNRQAIAINNRFANRLWKKVLKN